MSDYLTRLIERSLGSVPQIEPLIAPFHAPPDQMLSEKMDTPPAFESGSAAKIEISEQNTVPAAAANSIEPVLSQPGSQLTQTSSPLSESTKAFPTEKKDDRRHPIEVRPKVPSHQMSSVPFPEAVDITATSASPPPLPQATPMGLPAKSKVVIQPEIIERVEPASSPLVPALESSATEPPLLPNATPAPKRTTQIVIQPEIISPLQSAASPSLRTQQPSSSQLPAIHVTIGRVEVRAIMPPTATPKAKSPAARKLSLEDYLKQRNGGRS